MHLNIWMEGTVVKNGFEAVADEVCWIDPDIVMFSEASNKCVVGKTCTILCDKNFIIITYADDNSRHDSRINNMSARRTY